MKGVNSIAVWQSFIGKTIACAKVLNTLDPHRLRIMFDDGTGVDLLDGGQSGSGSRYMNTDDDLTVFTGSKLLGVSVKDGPSTHELSDEDELGLDECETQFLAVETSQGEFTCVNYNVHNGYYGGFYIVAKAVEMT